MKIHPAALWGALRRSSVQDAGLAALLLVLTWAVHDDAATPVISGWLGETVWLREPPVRWALIGVCVAAVAVRHRFPVAAFGAASVASALAMAMAVGPVPADLAAPIILYTVAARRPRKVSLALLAVALATATAWSVYVAVDGRADGWSYRGPFGGEAGLERPPADLVTPPADLVTPPADLVDPLAPPPRETGDIPPPSEDENAALGPSDWGGVPTFGCLLVAWATGWGIRSRRAYLGELRARARDLERERDQQAALAVAAERARITRELHDVVAHGLAVIVMQAQGGAAAFAKRPADTLAALDTIVATGRASLADMRHVLSATGPIDDPARPVPGMAQLPRLVNRVRQAGTPVRLHIDGSPRPLPASVDVSSYRIVQEALTNTMKHAGPGACAQVMVSYRSDELTIDASDNGRGEPSSGETGNGLRGMRERVALLGGEVTAGPGVNGGYVVRARIPLDREQTA